MAYFHCQSQIRIWNRTDSRTVQDFSIGSDSDSDPRIEMYVIGMENLSLGPRSDPIMGAVPIWKRDPNPSLSQWKHVLHNIM